MRQKTTTKLKFVSTVKTCQTAFLNYVAVQRVLDIALTVSSSERRRVALRLCLRTRGELMSDVIKFRVRKKTTLKTK